ncbi:MAG: hypothetical protein ACM3ZC_07380 [Bacteroidota bacterium]
MNVAAIVLGNLLIAGIMLGFAVVWNTVSWLRRRKEFSRPVYAYRPTRAEWSPYYWRRARRYIISYGLVLAIMIVLPVLFNRRAAIAEQLQGFASILPGLAAYFIIGGLIPARFTLHPEGFGCFALIPFLPGQRDRDGKTYSDFRVGFKHWRDYHDAVPRGDVLLLKGERIGAELLIPRGQRDRLLNLAREALKTAKDARRRQKKARQVAAR